MATKQKRHFFNRASGERVIREASSLPAASPAHLVELQPQPDGFVQLGVPGGAQLLVHSYSGL